MDDTKNWKPLPDTTLTGVAKAVREEQYLTLIALAEQLEPALVDKDNATDAFLRAKPGSFGVTGAALVNASDRVYDLMHEVLKAPEWMRALKPSPRLPSEEECTWPDYPNIEWHNGELRPLLERGPRTRRLMQGLLELVGPLIFTEEDLAPLTTECEHLCEKGHVCEINHGDDKCDCVCDCVCSVCRSEGGLWSLTESIELDLRHWEWLIKKGV